MALKPCFGCGKQVDTSAAACPGCGRPNPTKKNIPWWIPIGSLSLFVIVAVKTCGGGSSGAPTAAPTPRPALTAPSPSVIGALGSAMTDDINRQVVTDAIRQYEIAKRGGAKVDICVHAGMVAAAFMQAKDEAGYNKWKAIEKADCRRFGLPQ